MNAPRLSIIPAGAVTDRSLEPRDLQVLCLLGRHTDRAGWCSRSQVRMAAEIACGRSSVQRSLERLYEAGWVEKKRRDEAGKLDDSSQPSASYAYRVVLDRDDYAFENATRDAEDASDESHAENATEGTDCPPVGTPSNAEGAQPDGHPGAQPERAPGAHTYVGTKNVPLERSLIERERDARARDLKDRKARFIAAFEQRWPTAAADDRQRTGYAAEALTEEEEAAALAGIGPFLENLKRLGRKNTPAGWNYLEQKRWTLLEQPKDGPPVSALYARDSVEAKALLALHDIAGCNEGFRKIYVRSEGVSYRLAMTPQVRAFAQMPDRASWVTINRQQAGAWEALLRDVVTIDMRKRLAEGSRAPWPWPPSVEGKIYTEADGAPEMTAADHDALASEGQTTG